MEHTPKNLLIRAIHRKKQSDKKKEKAAQQVEEAAKGEPFTSLENFRNRTKAPQACIEKMKELGIMGDLSDTDQLSFDFL